MNLSELARQLKTEPQVLRQELPKLGIHIGQKALQLDDALVPKAIKAWALYQRQKKAKEKLKKKKEQSNKHTNEQKNHKKAVKSQTIQIPPTITVSAFAKKLGLKVSKVMIKLMQEGVMVAINQKIDYETAHILAEDLGFKTEQGEDGSKNSGQNTSETLTKLLTKEKNLQKRPPVVVIMGHVDHGKTTLLDCIRNADIVSQESGAITQHIGAYQIQAKKVKGYQNQTITFIDTPGHEAFKGMRSRGGQVADIAILVIAADDKIQPQTLESIEIIQKEGLGLIVAINKIDKADADVDRIKKQLSEINLTPEDWEGDTICVPVSAKKEKNINTLLENILVLAEINKLQASPKGKLFGVIIEAHIDKGLGPVATAIVQNGTLRLGDTIQCGQAGARIKKLQNYTEKSIKQATPSTPVRIIGFKTLPQVGDIIKKIKSLKKLKKAQKQQVESAQQAIAQSQGKQNKTQLKIHLKTDVSGTLEALVSEIAKIRHKLADIKIIKTGLGNFTNNDVLEAEAGSHILIGFKIDAIASAKHLITTRNVTFKTYSVIYKLLDDLRNSLESLLPPKIIEKNIGQAKILEVFNKTSQYIIVGGSTIKGYIVPEAKFRIISNGEPVGEGSIMELQSKKQAVKKVKEPQEFGIKAKGNLIIKPEDILQFYTVSKKPRTLKNVK